MFVDNNCGFSGRAVFEPDPISFGFLTCPDKALGILQYGVLSMRPLLLLLLFISPHGLAQTLDSPKIITEQNGRITNVRMEGSLASAQTVGCISLAEAKNTFTPPDLYKGVEECISKDKYDLAAGLFALAGIYGRFDAERITDKTAGQAKSVLIMNTFANESQDQKTKFNEVFTRLIKTPELFGKLCNEVQKVGMPNYYPSYMILHGIKAFTGNPHEGAMVKDFDPSKVWMNLQTAYLHCPA